MSSTPKIGDLLSGVGDAPLGATYHPAVVQEILKVAGKAIDLPESDIQNLTANDLKTKLSALPESIVTAVNEAVIDPLQLKNQSELDLTENLADVDPVGKTFRPTIALLMALLLFAAVVGYDALLWIVCYEAQRLPTIEEMLLPILAPGVIVVTYFGFMKRERQEIIGMLLNKTPLGGMAVGAAQKVLGAVAAGRK